MSIKVTSTSESAPAPIAKVEAAPKSVEAKPASAEKADEIIEASEALREPEEESSDEVDSDEEESQSKDVEPKKRSGFKRRIDKLTSKLSQKDQEIEFLRAEVTKSQKPKDEFVAPIVKVNVEGRPRSDDFDTHENFVEALTDWKMEQGEKVKADKLRQEQVKADFHAQMTAHLGRLDVFKKSVDDFDETIEDMGDMQLSFVIQDMILTSENGPELMYELAKDKKEFERINALPALAAARELGKLEARLQKQADSSELEPKIVKTTKAPAPIRTVGGNSTGGGKKSIFDPNIPQAEYEKLRRQQSSERT